MKFLLSILSVITIVIITIFLTIWMYDKNREDIDYDNSPIKQTEQVETRDNPPTKNNNSKVLDLSNRNLSKVPSYVFDMRYLEELDLSNNQLDGALPSQIGRNSNLRNLDVSNNNMTGIPAEIGQLSKLEKLNYADNGITGLPNEISNLKNLKEFNLTGNDYSKMDMEKIKENLPKLKIIE